MRAALVAVGLALLGGGLSVGHAGAADEPGAGLGVFSLQANAPALQVIASDGSTCFRNVAADNGCEAVVPEAVSTLRSGPIGHGLAAAVWPGTIAAGAGSLLITAGGSNVPPQATVLNDPVRADAYTNVGKPTQSDDTVPGTTMTATALPTRVVAQAAVGDPVVLAAVSAGTTAARSSVSLTGVHSASALSHSEVKDLTIAGTVRIASLVSDASATTDGVTASAQGRTVASGITVAGVSVTVDDAGAHALGQGASTTAAQATVDAALAGAGMQIALGAPQGRPRGGAVSYQAQSLVAVFGQPGLTTTVVLGGANVSVAASQGTAFATPAFQAPAAGGTDVPGTVAAPQPAAVLAGVAPVADAAQPPGTGPVAPVAQSAELPDPGRVSTRVVLLVVGAGLLLAGLLRRLPEVLRPVRTDCAEDR